VQVVSGLISLRTSIGASNPISIANSRLELRISRQGVARDATLQRGFPGVHEFIDNPPWWRVWNREAHQDKTGRSALCPEGQMGYLGSENSAITLHFRAGVTQNTTSHTSELNGKIHQARRS
jgi:hypothetical protein